MLLLSLSEDVLLRIFRLVPIQCSCVAAQACSLLADVLTHPTLWHLWCQMYFPGAVRSSHQDPRQCFLDLRSLSSTGLHLIAIDATAQDPRALTHAACCVTSGMVWLFGGRLPDGTMSSVLYLLQLSTGQWKQPFASHSSNVGPSARCFDGEHTGMVVVAERWLVLHGGLRPEGFRDNETWCLDTGDLETGWREVSPHLNYPQSERRPTPRYHHAMTTVGGSMCILSGGSDYSGETLGDCCILNLESVFSNDASGCAWAIHPVPVQRCWHTVTEVSPKTVLVFGGITDDIRDPQLECWQFDQDHLVSIEYGHRMNIKGQPPSQRYRHTAVSVRMCVPFSQ